MIIILDTLSILQNLCKKRGFWDTIEILIQYRHYEDGISLNSFYKILNAIGYYNSFYRIKDKLLSYRIIEMYKIKKKKFIKLTKKGIDMYDMMIFLVKEIKGNT